MAKLYTYNNDNRKDEQLYKDCSVFGLYVYDIDE